MIIVLFCFYVSFRSYCPPREKIQQTSFGEHEELLGIYNFKDKLVPDSLADTADDWGPNDM